MDNNVKNFNNLSAKITTMVCFGLPCFYKFYDSGHYGTEYFLDTDLYPD
jgi:hypothetical protein